MLHTSCITLLPACHGTNTFLYLQLKPGDGWRAKTVPWILVSLQIAHRSFFDVCVLVDWIHESLTCHRSTPLRRHNLRPLDTFTNFAQMYKKKKNNLSIKANLFSSSIPILLSCILIGWGDSCQPQLHLKKNLFSALCTASFQIHSLVALKDLSKPFFISSHWRINRSSTLLIIALHSQFCIKSVDFKSMKTISTST